MILASVVCIYIYVRHTQCDITLCHKFRAQSIDRVRTAGKRLCKRMSQSSGDVLERNEFLTKARKHKQRESAAEDSEDAKRRRKDDECQRKRAAGLRETPQRR